MSALLLLLASTFLVLAQTPDKTDTNRQAVDTSPPVITEQPIESNKPTHPDGIWPSQKLMHSILTRWADTISDEFELNDEKRQEVRKAVENREGPILRSIGLFARGAERQLNVRSSVSMRAISVSVAGWRPRGLVRNESNRR